MSVELGLAGKVLDDGQDQVADMSYVSVKELSNITVIVQPVIATFCC